MLTLIVLYELSLAKPRVLDAVPLVDFMVLSITSPLSQVNCTSISLSYVLLLLGFVISIASIGNYVTNLKFPMLWLVDFHFW